MQRVTGIGGVFIKAKNQLDLAKWYQKHLGIELGDNMAANFEWVDKTNPTGKGSTVFSIFKQESGYFKPSEQSYMINFRVHDLTALLEILQKEGVHITGPAEEFEYGKFAWILDPEGNKIELWEPAGED